MQSAPRKAAVPAFFRNKTIESYAARASTPISLRHMINFGQAGRTKGEREEADKLIKGGNFLRTELPIRLSHRLQDLNSLPFVIASHPRIERVMELYLEAFEGIRKFPLLKDLDDNDRFCQFMQGTLDKHRVVIPELAIGVSETSPLHLPAAALDRIMLRMLRSRISRRVITEQHIALTSQFRERQRKGKGRAVDLGEEEESRVGVVDTRLNAADVVRKCGELIKALGGPEGNVPIEIEGNTEQTFAYLSEHLEFMLFELIKNAAFSTVAAHGAEAAASHPILVSIIHGPRNLTIRVSDQGGGIPPYGGLPPDPADMTFNPLFPHTPIAAPLSAQRLDIFSFSHMRRYYQHHAALAAAASTTISPHGVNLSDPAAQQSAPESPPPSTAAIPPYIPSTTPPGSSPAPRGIAALRSLPHLTGTVAEQIERHRLRTASLPSSSSSSSPSPTSSPALSTTPTTPADPSRNELISAQMRSGIGLPLARLYAEYFQSTVEDVPGSLEIMTLQGYGSDGLLRLPKFGLAK
ncbi:hypothetical protein JCM10207_005025 [Rhodosporidiobolus poonsookiae]